MKEENAVWRILRICVEKHRTDERCWSGKMFIPEYNQILLKRVGNSLSWLLVLSVPGLIFKQILYSSIFIQLLMLLRHQTHILHEE